MGRKKYVQWISFLIIVIFITVAFFLFSFFSSHQLYNFHEKLSIYKNTRIESWIPASAVKMIASWHELSYADMKWMSVIQFIGDSLLRSKDTNSIHRFLQYITALHPSFSQVYELDLLLTPIIPESATGSAYKHAKTRVQNTLYHAKNGMLFLCDTQKVDKILHTHTFPDIWKDSSLKNPCISWLVPYYIWMHTLFSLGDGEWASQYYKIASMNDDAPEASKYLVFLAKTYAGNPFDGALSSLLVWASWYDREPYECLNATKEVLATLHTPQDITPDFLLRLEKTEKSLKDTRSPSIPESNNATNCFDSFKRATKAFYIAYVTEQGKKYPEVTDAQDFMKMGIISHIPTVRWQEGYKLLKRWSIWNFFKQ